MKLAVPNDPFCSSFCCKIHYGVIELSTATPYEKRKLREMHQNGPSFVEVENTEALNRRVPGSFEGGKRR